MFFYAAVEITYGGFLCARFMYGATYATLEIYFEP